MDWLTNLLSIDMGLHYSLDQLLDNLFECGRTKKKRKLLEAAAGCLLWCVRKARNNVVFNGQSFSVQLVGAEVQATLFTWVKFRANCNVLWSD